MIKLSMGESDKIVNVVESNTGPIPNFYGKRK